MWPDLFVRTDNGSTGYLHKRQSVAKASTTEEPDAENCTSGTVRGASGNGRPHRGGLLRNIFRKLEGQSKTVIFSQQKKLAFDILDRLVCR